MTSRYLQALCICGELESRRDPVVMALLNILRHDTEQSICFAADNDFGGYTLEELQTALLDVSGVLPEVTAARLATWTARGLFKKKFSTELSATVYTFNINSIYAAQGDNQLLVYFSPETVFPWLINSPAAGSSISTTSAGTGLVDYRKVNTRKGVLTDLK